MVQGCPSRCVSKVSFEVQKDGLDLGDLGGRVCGGAYEEAYSWVEELEASGRTANVPCDWIECHVYAVRMKPTAWNVGKFARRNAHIPESVRASMSCFYVGQTGLRTVEERFNRHIGGGRHKTTWGRNHSLRPFEMAHDDGGVI